MLDRILSAMGEHPFWFLLTASCMIWYSTITVYVAFRGVFDIRNMLRHLSKTAGLPQEQGLDSSQTKTLK
jgi:hypothetical protein